MLNFIFPLHFVFAAKISTFIFFQNSKMNIAWIMILGPLIVKLPRFLRTSKYHSVVTHQTPQKIICIQFQDVKLRKLVQVTKSHVTYVNYFLSEFSNDEKSSRSDWEKKRFRLLQMSFIILNGLNELITKVKRTDFYTKFIHAKRKRFK